MVHLRPLPPGGLGARDVDVMSAVPLPDDPLDFLGPMLEDSIARGIAAGVSHAQQCFLSLEFCRPQRPAI